MKLIDIKWLHSTTLTTKEAEQLLVPEEYEGMVSIETWDVDGVLKRKTVCVPRVSEYLRSFGKFNEVPIEDPIEKPTETEEKDYDKMKADAAEFSKILIKGETEFNHEVSDCGDGVASYFEISAKDNKKILVYFKDNGYLGWEVEDEE